MATASERAMTAAELRERMAADPSGGWNWRDAAKALAAAKATHPRDRMARAELFDLLVECLEAERQLVPRDRHEAALEAAERIEFGIEAAVAWSRP